MMKRDSYRPTWLAASLVTGAIAGVLLGALQVTGAPGEKSPYYFYKISNFGSATGFFANSNHMASLLVSTVPFLFAFLAANRRMSGKNGLQRRTSAYLLIVGAMLVVLLGLILNGSLAGFALLLPVIIASGLLLFGWRKQRRWVAVPALLLVGAVVAGAAMPISDRYDGKASVESRKEMAAKSWSSIQEFLPLGSGLGTFEKVYRLQEDPAAVDRTYVNHAHNDYLELLLELGIPGLLLLAAFLLWWATTALGRWRDNLSDPFVKAAVIASAALLSHSLVDFPLRTAALSGLFAATLALIAAANRPGPAQRGDLRPTRHLEIR